LVSTTVLTIILI